MTRATAPWATLVWDALERMRTPVITSVTNLVERQFGASLSQELTLLTSCVDFLPSCGLDGPLM